jgi:hypothetical protein
VIKTRRTNKLTKRSIEKEIGKETRLSVMRMNEMRRRSGIRSGEDDAQKVEWMGRRGREFMNTHI